MSAHDKSGSRGIVLFVILAVLCVLGGVWLGPQAVRKTNDQRIKIGFIGDSITHGPDESGGAVGDEIKSLGSGRYEAFNQGVNGSTTDDWQPGHSLFNNALTHFKQRDVRIVSLMLGTNDARTDRHVNPETYSRNMRAIVHGLLASGAILRVIINYPPYAAPGTHHGLWTDDSAKRLIAYRTTLDSLVQEQGVSKGDTEAYRYFEAHPNQLVDGVHPDASGNKMLGRLWADAFVRTHLFGVTQRPGDTLVSVLAPGLI